MKMFFFQALLLHKYNDLLAGRVSKLDGMKEGFRAKLDGMKAGFPN